MNKGLIVNIIIDLTKIEKGHAQGLWHGLDKPLNSGVEFPVEIDICSMLKVKSFAEKI